MLGIEPASAKSLSPEQITDEFDSTDVLDNTVASHSDDAGGGSRVGVEIAWS